MQGQGPLLLLRHASLWNRGTRQIITCELKLNAPCCLNKSYQRMIPFGPCVFHERIWLWAKVSAIWGNENFTKLCSCKFKISISTIQYQLYLNPFFCVHILFSSTSLKRFRQKCGIWCRKFVDHINLLSISNIEISKCCTVLPKHNNFCWNLWPKHGRFG